MFSTDSEAASNGNFNGLSSLGGNWLSACEGDALTNLDVSTDLSVEGGSVTIYSCRSQRHSCSFRGLVILDFICHFLRQTVHCAYQKFSIKNS